jgi:hypothetical protein
MKGRYVDCWWGDVNKGDDGRSYWRTSMEAEIHRFLRVAML